MYEYKTNKLIDRREMLRVKLKSLAAEAKFIRREELRTHGALRNELHNHRVNEVRRAARTTHMAYGLIRGLRAEQVERKSVTPLDWDAVEKMVKKYGPNTPLLLNGRAADPKPGSPGSIPGRGSTKVAA